MRESFRAIELGMQATVENQPAAGDVDDVAVGANLNRTRQPCEREGRHVEIRGRTMRTLSRNGNGIQPTVECRGTLYRWRSTRMTRRVHAATYRGPSAITSR